MAVLYWFNDSCNQPLLRVMLMVLLLQAETGNVVSDSLMEQNMMEPNRSKHDINSFGFILESTSLTVAAHGRPAYFGEFSHMAAIGWSQPEGPPLWNCGGSLLWGNYILTAAHCAIGGNGIAPDVARVGDLNLYDASDDRYAQQGQIVEIIRHPDHVFSKKYHDIALMRLDKRLTLGVGVAPLCLWNGDVSHFPSFEAVGWGDTGFLEERSPILLKVSLSPVDLSQCSRHYLRTRGLGVGLQDSQMCAGDIKMDTCPGDSGGPLQVKLLNNTRVIPFVVGITSFGAACGFSVPGVYTKVAPYIPWIFNVLKAREERVDEWMFQPEACATDYVELRENDPPVGQDGTTIVEYQDLGRVLVLEHKKKMGKMLHEEQQALNRCDDKTERLCVN